MKIADIIRILLTLLTIQKYSYSTVTSLLVAGCDRSPTSFLACMDNLVNILNPTLTATHHVIFPETLNTNFLYPYDLWEITTTLCLLN